MRASFALYLTAITILLLSDPLQAADVLVPAGATWKYLDNGSDQGTAWQAVGFNDIGWAQGPAELGYGDGDEATVISFGPNSNNKFITTYFRHSFNVADPSIFTNVSLRLLRDDGAAVYLNGTEVVRSNLPALADFQTVANTTISAAGEHNFAWKTIDPALLVAGTNVLAVEVHQRSATSSDVSFNAELLADSVEFITRGPYLQQLAPTEITLRWRTDAGTDSRVWYGLSPFALNSFVDDANVVTLHEITLTGLTPNTRYYYGVGKSTQMLAGGSTAHTFLTAPPVGTVQPVRVWVVGDSGTADASAQAVRDAFKTHVGPSTHTDVWLMLGDNAYDQGLRSEYQAAVFDTYPSLLTRTVLWPARGNHELSASVYYDLFTLPTQAEAGGTASGTEAYYSFDYANIHFICLDSEGSPRNVGGAMYSWLQADLAATQQEWIIAFWHHPPYTKGSHNSDAEIHLIDMRSNFLPLLEAGGVDLVLTGHSHSYERSFLIDNHYGNSGSFQESMKVDGGDGRPSGDGAYLKCPGANEGAVYCVAGSSGKLSSGPLNHPAMYHSVMILGSVILDIDGEQLDITFLDSNGNVEDTCRIEHYNPWLNLGNSLAGTQGVPSLTGHGTMAPDSTVGLTLENARAATPTFLVVGFSAINAPFSGGTIVPFPNFLYVLPTNGAGILDITGPWPASLPSGFQTFYQYWIVDPLAPQGLAASNAISGTTP